MLSNMVCSLSGRWEVHKVLCHTLITCVHIYYDDEQDRTKKAVLGDPSSDETFPLREKTKF